MVLSVTRYRYMTPLLSYVHWTLPWALIYSYPKYWLFSVFGIRTAIKCYCKCIHCILLPNSLISRPLIIPSGQARLLLEILSYWHNNNYPREFLQQSWTLGKRLILVESSLSQVGAITITVISQELTMTIVVSFVVRNYMYHRFYHEDKAI